MQLCLACFRPQGHPGKCAYCGYDPDQVVNSSGLPVGTILFHGQYKIGKILGKPGGFGIAYLALDINLNTLVAIKEYFPRQLVGRDTNRVSIYPHSQEDQETFNTSLVEFVREARTVALLNHPNIVRVRSFFEENSTAYIVMDYLEGQTLDEYLTKIQRIREPEAIQMLNPIFDALAYIHQRNFLHRDVKPQNIFITNQGTPMLLDFGASRQFLQNKSNSLTSIMTPGYAPMEQYNRKGHQGPWTDIYSCAATLYHMLIGEPPPEAPARISGEQLADLRNRSFALSNPMITMIQSGLMIEPEKRPQSIKDFTTIYHSTEDSQVVKTNPDKPEQARPQPLQKQEQNSAKFPKYAVMVVVVILAVGFLGWMFARSDSGNKIVSIPQNQQMVNSAVNRPAAQTPIAAPIVPSGEVQNTNVKVPITVSPTAQNAIVRQTVVDFYNYIANKKHRAAWEYLSSRWKQSVTYSQWVAGYDDTISTQLDFAEVIGNVSAKDTQALVRVQLTAKNREGNRVLIQSFSGEITLARSGVFWILDDSNLRKISSRYEK